MSFWQHPPRSQHPKKKQAPSIPQIKALLLDRHGIMADAIANLTINEEKHIHGYAKEEDEWHEFTIYRY